MTPQERAEALYRAERHEIYGTWIVFHACGMPMAQRDDEARARATVRLLAAPIAAAIEAAARDATEAAARVCDARAQQYDARRPGDTVDDIARRSGKATVARDIADAIRGLDATSQAATAVADGFAPARNPLDARLAKVALHEPVLHATLTGWRQGHLTRAEALTRAIELLADGLARTRTALTQRCEAEPPLAVLVRDAPDLARLLSLAPRCTAVDGCAEPATWVSRCSLVQACDEHTDGDFSEAPHAALVRALRWPANAPLTTQKETRG